MKNNCKQPKYMQVFRYIEDNQASKVMVCHEFNMTKKALYDTLRYMKKKEYSMYKLANDTLNKTEKQLCNSKGDKFKCVQYAEYMLLNHTSLEETANDLGITLAAIRSAIYIQLQMNFNNLFIMVMREFKAQKNNRKLCVKIGKYIVENNADYKEAAKAFNTTVDNIYHHVRYLRLGHKALYNEIQKIKYENLS